MFFVNLKYSISLLVQNTSEVSSWCILTLPINENPTEIHGIIYGMFINLILFHITE